MTVHLADMTVTMITNKHSTYFRSFQCICPQKDVFLFYIITSKTLLIYCMHVSQQKVDKVTKKNTQKTQTILKKYE